MVRGLLDTLEGMGFEVEGPDIQESDKRGGTVTLVGKLPSGRLARFEKKLIQPSDQLVIRAHYEWKGDSQ